MKDFDFGFTFSDSEEVAKPIVEEKFKEHKSSTEIVEEMYNQIMPLLDNLYGDNKDYIYWPWRTRQDTIGDFKHHLEDLVTKAKNT